MFGIFKTYRDVKKGVKDPGGLAQEMALDVVKGPLLVFTILASIFFIGLFIVSFTGLIGGPLFLKIIFWILFLPTLLILSVAWMFLGKIKKTMDSARCKMGQNSDIITAEVVKGDKDLT